MRQIAVLLTCHNRRAQTVACLKALDAAARHQGTVVYKVFLTDDGSTDGTAESVGALGMPIAILRGPGDLYWNRGMVNSWRAADQAPDRFDGYLLLNDDTVLDENGLSNMIATSEASHHAGVIVGAVRDAASGMVTYGGVLRTSRWHPGRTRTLAASSEVQFADTFNANCVYLPIAVAKHVGCLDPVFQHSMGDFDYGYRARRLGYPVIIAPNTVGVCSKNRERGTWRDRSMALPGRLKHLQSPKGLPYREWRTFLRRHSAPFPSLLAAAPYVWIVWSSLIAMGRQRTRARMAEQ